MDLSKYFVKKSVASIQAEAEEAAHLKRALGPLNLILLGIGCIIGAGIFVLTGKAAATSAGPAIALSFVLAAIACALAGLCYAELASLMPISGSAYTYTYATLGEVVAWVVGWLLILEYGLGGSTVAVGWSGYVVSLLRDFGIHIPPELSNPYFGGEVTLPNGDKITPFFNLPAFLVIMFVTVLLVIGIKESATVNNVVVAIKLAVIAVFLAVGSSYVDTSNWHPFIPENTGEFGKFGYSGVLTAAGSIFFAYIGFDAVSAAAQEAKNPERDLPLGIIGSLIICTVLYIAVSLVMTGVVHYSELNVPEPIAVAVDAMGVKSMVLFVKAGVIAGLSTVILVLLYAQTRIFYAMSRDGLLPPVFSAVHPKFKTPHLSTLIVGFLVGLAAALFPIGVIGDLVSVGTLIAFTIVCAGVAYLRRTQPDLPRPFKCPLVPWVPLGGMAACLFLISGMMHTIWNIKIWLVLGAVIYIFYSRKHSKIRKA